MDLDSLPDDHVLTRTQAAEILADGTTPSALRAYTSLGRKTNPLKHTRDDRGRISIRAADLRAWRAARAARAEEQRLATIKARAESSRPADAIDLANLDDWPLDQLLAEWRMRKTLKIDFTPWDLRRVIIDGKPRFSPWEITRWLSAQDD